jgi:hypothetical protein
MPAYTTRAVVKTYLGIPSGTSSEDDPIDAAIDAAEAEIDAHTGRTFVVPGSATAKVYRPVNDRVVLVDDIAQTTSLAVKVDGSDDGSYDTTLTITSEFVVDGNTAPYRVIRRVDGSAFPRYTSDRATIQITAYFGYGMSIPKAIVQASTVLGARLYQRRSSPLGFQAGLEGDAVRISRIDPDVRALLSGYRLPAVA